MKEYKGTRVLTGLYQGKLIEEILITHPEYVQWLVRRARSKDKKAFYRQLDAAIKTFERKPFRGVSCAGQKLGLNCPAKPKWTFLNRNTRLPVFFCDRCRLIQFKDIPENRLMKSYMSFLALARIHGLTIEEMNRVTKAWAKAKGLNGTASEEQILNFFRSR